MNLSRKFLILTAAAAFASFGVAQDKGKGKGPAGPGLTLTSPAFADGAEIATERELVEQDWTRKTEDFKEGVKSYAEKRSGNFKGR